MIMVHQLKYKIKSVKSFHPRQSVIQTIAKAHGGEIKTESKESEGSRFIIQLPNQHI